MKKLTLTLAIALFALAGTAFAYPSLLGPTGGANLPNAVVVAPGVFCIAADFVNANDTFPVASGTISGVPAVVNETNDNIGNFRLLYGVMQNLEIGASYIHQNAHLQAVNASTGANIGDSVSANLSNWGVNAKYVLPKLFLDSDLGLGVVYMGFNDDSGVKDISQLYAVATKSLTPEDAAVAVRGSLGVNWSNAELTDAAGGGSTNAFRPFIDVDLAFANKLNLTAEYQLKNDDFDTDAMASIVARYPITDSLAAELGFSNAVRGVAGSDRYNLLVGVNYKFGMAK